MATAAVVVTGVWMRRPAATPAPVTRFSFSLPDGQAFSDVFFPSVAISPDGMQIAYMANQRLYLRGLSDLTVRPIAGSESPGTNMGSAVFSPDGRSIAYWVRTALPRPNLGSQIGGELRRAPTGGGTPFTILKTEYVPDGIQWSGETLVFPQGKAIVRVSANGSVPERLVEVKDDEQIEGAQLLPGGGALLFSIRRSAAPSAASAESTEVIAQRLGSTERRTLVPGSYARYLSTGHLVFVRSGVVFAVAFDPERLEVEGSPVPVLDGVQADRTATATAANLHLPIAFRDFGLRHACVRPWNRQSIDATKRIASRSSRLNHVVEGAARIVSDPTCVSRWEATGSRLERERRARVDRRSLRHRATSPPDAFGHNRFPIWSNDGRQIVFQSDRDGDLAIFSQQADGAAAAERLTTPEKGVAHFPVAWFSDEARFLYAERRGTTATLWVIPPRSPSHSVQHD